MDPRDADRLTNNVDPDQTAQSEFGLHVCPDLSVPILTAL